jgi:hypothetical protein
MEGLKKIAEDLSMRADLGADVWTSDTVHTNLEWYPLGGMCICMYVCIVT